MIPMATHEKDTAIQRKGRKMPCSCPLWQDLIMLCIRNISTGNAKNMNVNRVKKPSAQMHPTLTENQIVNVDFSFETPTLASAVEIVVISIERQIVSNVLENGRESITIAGQALASSKFGGGTLPLIA